MATQIRAMTADDWEGVASIYAKVIASGEVTFEVEVPSWKKFDSTKIAAPRLVAVTEEGKIAGVAVASQASPRAAYAGVIEHSIYLSSAHHGQGIGKQLLQAFIDAAEDAGYTTIQGIIFPENSSSLALHEKFGFRIVGKREKIALTKFGPNAGTWRDTILIERRSKQNGI